MLKPAAIAGQVVLYGAFAAVIGYFATDPVYHQIPDDVAVIKVSFAHLGERECRKRTPEELEKMPKNMRAPMDCPRERSDIAFELDLNGQNVVKHVLHPTGLYKDGISTMYRRLEVKAGTYKEQVTINKPFVCLVGESATTTTISYTIDNNILTGGTVLVKANDFSAANIAFENTHGKGESGGQNQAVAVMCQGQRHQFRNCRFLSYQDTLYTNTGTQYFRDCFIQGSVDYIFGDATGYIKAIDKEGKNIWSYFLGDTIISLAISDDEKKLWVASCSGMIHMLTLDAGKRDNHTIGNGNHYEEFRVILWKNELQPLIW